MPKSISSVLALFRQMKSVLEIAVKGDFPQLELALLEKPDVKIKESDNTKLAKQIINDFLNNNYSRKTLIADLMKQFAIQSFNIDDIKSELMVIKEQVTKNIQEQINQIQSDIQTEMNKILQALDKVHV